MNLGNIQLHTYSEIHVVSKQRQHLINFCKAKVNSSCASRKLFLLWNPEGSFTSTCAKPIKLHVLQKAVVIIAPEENKRILKINSDIQKDKLLLPEEALSVHWTDRTCVTYLSKGGKPVGLLVLLALALQYITDVLYLFWRCWWLHQLAKASRNLLQHCKLHWWLQEADPVRQYNLPKCCHSAICIKTKPTSHLTFLKTHM